MVLRKTYQWYQNDGASGKRQMDGILKFVDAGNVVNGTTANVLQEKLRNLLRNYGMQEMKMVNFTL